MPDSLVLVGKRRRAIEAADALGIPVVLISDRSASNYQCLVSRLPPHQSGDRDSLIALADRIQANCAPLGVIALTEDAVLPAAEIRQALDLPGLTPDQAVPCIDKLAMKKKIRAAGLLCADFCSAEDEMSKSDLIERLGMPMIIKPRIGSGGRGTQLVSKEAEVPDRLNKDSLAERIVSGREMSIESFIVDGEILFSNVTDYFDPGWANIVPGKLADERRSQVETLNRAALKALSLDQGVTHLEFYLQEERVVFGEVAARPPGGHVMDLIGRAWGFDAWQALIRLALGEIAAFPRAPSAYAGVRILHPGQGIVEHIDGLEDLSALPTVRHVALSAHPGRRYAARTGVGEEAGHVIVSDPSLDKVQQALRKAARDLQFRVRRH